MLIEEKYKKIIGLPENNRLKYEPLLPSSSELGRIICAFANTEGGTIILGIKSKNNKISTVGLSSDFQVTVVLANSIAELSPLPKIEHGSITHQEKQLYVIIVEKSDDIVAFKKIEYGIKSKKIFDLNSVLGNDNNQNIPFRQTEIYLDLILEYLLKNPGLINVNKHTIKETIFQNHVSIPEAEHFMTKLRDSENVTSYGERCIGISHTTKSFLEGGGYSKSKLLDYDKMNHKKIFISYNWNHKNTANKLFNFLKSKGFEPSMDDHSLIYKDSISTFMESIRSSDFAVIILSDDYLKSENCMIEVLHLLKDRDSKKKILPIRHEEVKIFKPIERVKYIEFWKAEVEEREKILKGIDSTSAVEEIKKLKNTKRIYQEIGDFLADISDMVTRTIEEQEGNSYEYILNYIGKNQK